MGSYVLQHKKVYICICNAQCLWIFNENPFSIREKCCIILLRAIWYTLSFILVHHGLRVVKGRYIYSLTLRWWQRTLCIARAFYAMPLLVFAADMVLRFTIIYAYLCVEWEKGEARAVREWIAAKTLGLVSVCVCVMRRNICVCRCDLLLYIIHHNRPSRSRGIVR